MRRPTVAVVGAGISGLVAAHHLRTTLPDVDLIVLERSGRVGGMVHTERWQGRVIEYGPEGFVTNRPEALDLVAELGMTEQLVTDGPAPRQTFIARGDELVPLPYGVMNPDRTAAADLMRSRLLSLRGRARLAVEPLVPRRRDPDDESVAAFVRRRFGAEMLDALVEPLVGGIHGSGTGELSAELLLPALRRIELEGRSVALAALRRGRGDPGARPLPPLVSLRDGMGSLTDTLAARLGDSLRLGIGVAALDGITGSSGRCVGWELTTDDGEHLRVDGLVLATPPAVTGTLLHPFDPELAGAVRSMPWGSSTTVTLIWEVGDVAPIDIGTGYLVASRFGGRVAACTFVSAKWHHRSPEGSLMIRCFLRGVETTAPFAESDAVLVDEARAELARRVGVTAMPIRTIVERVPVALPVMAVGHRRRVDAVHTGVAALGPVALAGAGLEGAGIPACIRSGRLAAAAIANRVKTT